MDTEAAAAAVVELVRSQVGKAVAPLLAEIAHLKEKIGFIEELGCAPTAEEVAPLVLPPMIEEVRREIASLPPAEPGEAGKSVSLDEVASLFERRFSDLALHWERTAGEVFQRAIDRMPKPKDGIDGLGFHDLSVFQNSEREFTIRFAKGDQVKAFTFDLPLVIDRGFWKEGFVAEKGDGLTFGGSYWIAQKGTDTKPEIDNPDWRLAVRKGRDGKSSK